jgi:hypothetical protein
MRLIASLLCLAVLTGGTLARAQQTGTPATPPSSSSTYTPQAEPPPATEPVAPTTTGAQEPTATTPMQPATPEPPPGYQGPAESASARALRYSRFSAGAGGPLLIFTEVLSGLVTGAMVGRASGADNGAYVGAVLTSLTLATGAAIYQYYVPVERMETLLAAGGAATGFLAGFGFSLEQDSSDRSRAITTLLTTQAGVIAVLAATAGGGDVSAGDASLVGMSSLYAFALTALVQSATKLANPQRDLNLTPSLLAPAIGMGIGGLLTLSLELSSERVFKLTVIPMGVGATLMLVGTMLANGPAVPLTSLGGVVATFVITWLATAEPIPGAPPTRRELQPQLENLVPVPVVVSAGRRGESLGAGPGLLLRF